MSESEEHSGGSMPEEECTMYGIIMHCALCRQTPASNQSVYCLNDMNMI